MSRRRAGLAVAGCVHRVHWVQVGAWSRDACSRICLQASRLHAPTCTQCTRCTQPATERPAYATELTTLIDGEAGSLSRFQQFATRVARCEAWGGVSVRQAVD